MVVHQRVVCFVSQYTGACHKRRKHQYLLHWIPGTWSGTLLILRTCTGNFPGEVLVIRTSTDRSPGTQPHYAKCFGWTVTSSDISRVCTSGFWKLNSKKFMQCYKSLGMPTKMFTWKKMAPYMQEKKKNALINITKNNWSSLHLFLNSYFYRRSFISHFKASLSYKLPEKSRN